MASYYVWSGATGSANGTTWANAYTTLTAAFSGKAAGDVLYVAHDHAESTAGAVVLTLAAATVINPLKVICVDRGGTVPPVSADRRATAQVSTTGANAITLNSFVHYDGIIFTVGISGTAGASNVLVLTSGSVNWLRLDNCSLRLGAACNASSSILFGFTSTAQYIEMNNTTLSFSNASQFLAVTGLLRWRNTPAAVLGTAPTTLFIPVVARGSSAECIGVDLSAMGSGKLIVDTNGSQGSSYRFVDCKLNASVTKSNVPSGAGAPDIDFIRSGAAGVSYNVHRHRQAGLLTEETTIVRTGGASDGTTTIAWKIVTTANCSYSMPFECPPIAIWCDTTGSAKTATIECIGTAVATDQEVWVDLEYLGDASSPQGSFVNDGKSDLLATAANQTSSSATWGGALTGKFKLAVTFTAQQKGWVYARVRCAKPSATFYVDPLITLT